MLGSLRLTASIIMNLSIIAPLFDSRDGRFKKKTGDNYHVLKYHDIQYYHHNAFGFHAKLDQFLRNQALKLLSSSGVLGTVNQEPP